MKYRYDMPVIDMEGEVLERIDQERMIAILEHTLSHLGKRERQVIEFCFGLNGKQKTNNTKAGEVLGVCNCRIGQIYKKAIYRLRNWSRYYNEFRRQLDAFRPSNSLSNWDRFVNIYVDYDSAGEIKDKHVTRRELAELLKCPVGMVSNWGKFLSMYKDETGRVLRCYVPMIMEDLKRSTRRGKKRNK